MPTSFRVYWKPQQMIDENNMTQLSKLLIVPLILVIGGTYWYLNRDDKMVPRLADTVISKNTPIKITKEKQSVNKSVNTSFSNESEDSSAFDSKLFATVKVVKSSKSDNDISSSTIEDETIQEGSFESGTPQYFESISKGVEQLISSLDMEQNDNNLAIGKIKQNLLNVAKKDSLALENLINRFEANLDNQSVKDELMDILSAIKDPEVEALGMKLARSGDHKRIIDGVNLLSQLSIPNEETLALMTQLVSENSTSSDILLPAIHAMPVIPVPEEKRSEILRELSGLSQHESEGVRSESIFAISKWAKNEQQLSPVIDALQSETVDDKISAVMALEKSPVVSTNLKQILLARMVDDNELWEVRSISSDALKRFDLTSSEYSEYKRFKEKQISDAH